MLALVPAGFLVLILLAALAVDSAVAYLGQEQLHDSLSAAATDSVTAGIDNSSFYRSGILTLDPAAVARTLCLAMLAQDNSSLRDIRLWMAVAGDSVVVEGRATVDTVFGRAIPGLDDRTVRSSAEAVVASGPASARSTSVGPLTPVDCDQAISA